MSHRLDCLITCRLVAHSPPIDRNVYILVSIITVVILIILVVVVIIVIVATSSLLFALLLFLFLHRFLLFIGPWWFAIPCVRWLFLRFHP